MIEKRGQVRTIIPLSSRLVKYLYKWDTRQGEEHA